MSRLYFSHKFYSACFYTVLKRNYEYKYDNLPARPSFGPTTLKEFIFPKGRDYFEAFRKKYDFSWANIQRMWDEVQNQSLIEDQRFIYDRHRILGANLATAHFVVYRGGAVKFHGDKEWIRHDPQSDEDFPLPNSFVPNYYLEGVDFSNSDLLYEGLDNFINLFKLKTLNLSNCKHIDDWCLDRMYQFDSLEHLDISSCHQVTERGIAALAKLKNLKTVNLTDLPKASNLELVSMMLEDAIPQCQVVGVNYMALAPKYLEPS